MKVGSAEDVSTVLQVVAATRTPFAVYSGGHSSNPGFSSTKGVHISLDRLNAIVLSEDKKVVRVGFGAVRIQGTWLPLSPANRCRLVVGGCL